jgi:hypothetical protein
MRAAIGIVTWSVFLLLAYREAPRILPHSTKLARFAVGCASLMIPAFVEVFISGRPQWSTAGTLATALLLIAAVGGFTGLVCLSIALILDGVRS